VTGQPLIVRIRELGDDVGRLRRHVDPESYAGHLAGRIAAHVESLLIQLQPTAAELYQRNLAREMSNDDAMAAALEETEQRAKADRSLVGGPGAAPLEEQLQAWVDSDWRAWIEEIRAYNLMIGAPA
jgi:hypothetical protein